MARHLPIGDLDDRVSMESGLEGRNNDSAAAPTRPGELVSMESGLEGRNNPKDHVRRRRGVWSQWSPA